jgi:hypothetical protein
MLFKIPFCILQAVLRLHRQHDEKLPHGILKFALKQAQNRHETVLMIVKMEHGTLDSLRAQGTGVTAKNQTLKIMSTSIVSAEAKARLQEAVKNYTPPAPEKYRALEEVKDCISELRQKKASYQIITTLLHDNAGIEVSHQTVARYCREVLESRSAKAAKKSNRSHALKSDSTRAGNGEAGNGHAPSSHLSPQSSRSRGSRIADIKTL